MDSNPSSQEEELDIRISSPVNNEPVVHQSQQDLAKTVSILLNRVRNLELQIGEMQKFIKTHIATKPTSSAAEPTTPAPAPVAAAEPPAAIPVPTSNAFETSHAEIKLVSPASSTSTNSYSSTFEELSKQSLSKATASSSSANPSKASSSSGIPEVEVIELVDDQVVITKKPLPSYGLAAKFKDNGVKVPSFMAKKLMPHQLVGVKLLLQHQNLVLADYMGLGKTLQIATFLSIHLTANPEDTILILCPASVIRHWEREFDRIRSWKTEEYQDSIDMNDASNEEQIEQMQIEENEKIALSVPRPTNLSLYKTATSRSEAVNYWREGGGVMLCTYDLYRSLFFSDEEFQDSASECSMVILDEGHKIKHMDAKISRCLQKMKTSKRIVLTGYPLQNNLVEYYTMISFVRPDFLGPLTAFKFEFVKPIAKGQSSEDPKLRKMAKKRAWYLHQLVSPLIIRRDVSFIRDKLPKKHEMVVMIKPTPVQQAIYQSFFDKMSESGGRCVFWAFNVITMISNHPDILKQYYLKKKKEAEKQLTGLKTTQKSPSKRKIIDDEYSDEESEETADSLEDETTQIQMALKLDILGHVFDHLEASKHKVEALENSLKMMVLFNILFQSKAIGDKCVVFSKSIPSLDFIEATIKKFNIQQASNPIHYTRFDGSTALEERQSYIDKFNDEKGNLDVFLISTLAGGEGINLYAANRVILMDSNWNPSHDTEACCRVYRLGQKKQVYIYRLVVKDSMEERVYEKQLKKELLSKWVVDDRPSVLSQTSVNVKLFAAPNPTKMNEVIEVDEKITDPVAKHIATVYAKNLDSIQLQDCLLTEDPLDELTEQEKREAASEREYDSVYGKKRKTKASSGTPGKKAVASSSTPARNTSTTTSSEPRPQPPAERHDFAFMTDTAIPIPMICETAGTKKVRDLERQQLERMEEQYEQSNLLQKMQNLDEIFERDEEEEEEEEVAPETKPSPAATAPVAPSAAAVAASSTPEGAKPAPTATSAAHKLLQQEKQLMAAKLARNARLRNKAKEIAEKQKNGSRPIQKPASPTYVDYVMHDSHNHNNNNTSQNNKQQQQQQQQPNNNNNNTSGSNDKSKSKQSGLLPTPPKSRNNRDAMDNRDNRDNRESSYRKRPYNNGNINNYNEEEYDNHSYASYSSSYGRKPYYDKQQYDNRDDYYDYGDRRYRYQDQQQQYYYDDDDYQDYQYQHYDKKRRTHENGKSTKVYNNNSSSSASSSSNNSASASSAPSHSNNKSKSKKK